MVVFKKNDKNVFKLAFMLLLSPKFLTCWKLTNIDKINFQHYRKTKMSQIIVFWSNREIKMPRNVVFRLNTKASTIAFNHSSDNDFQDYESLQKNSANNRCDKDVLKTS